MNLAFKKNITASLPIAQHFQNCQSMVAGVNGVLGANVAPPVGRTSKPGIANATLPIHKMVARNVKEQLWKISPAA